MDLNVSKIVQLQQYLTLNNVIKLALKVEWQQSKEKTSSKNTSTRFSLKTNPSRTTTKKTESPAGTSKLFKQANNPTSRRCFKRQGFGHIALECPNVRMISFVEEYILEEEVQRKKVKEITMTKKSYTQMKVNPSLFVVFSMPPRLKKMNGCATISSTLDAHPMERYVMSSLIVLVARMWLLQR